MSILPCRGGIIWNRNFYHRINAYISSEGLKAPRFLTHRHVNDEEEEWNFGKLEPTLLDPPLLKSLFPGFPDFVREKLWGRGCLCSCKIASIWPTLSRGRKTSTINWAWKLKGVIVISTFFYLLTAALMTMRWQPFSFKKVSTFQTGA